MKSHLKYKDTSSKISIAHSLDDCAWSQHVWRTKVVETTPTATPQTPGTSGTATPGTAESSYLL